MNPVNSNVQCLTALYSHVNIKSLVNLGNLSHGWKQATDVFWSNFCKEIDLPIKHKSSFLLSLKTNDHFTFASFKETVIFDSWLKIYKIRQNLLPEDQAAVFLCDGPKTNSDITQCVRNIAASKILKNEFPLNQAFLPALKTSHNNDQEEVLEAQVLIAKLHVENKVSFLKDSEVSQLLKKISSHHNCTKHIKINALYEKAILGCQDRDSDSSYPTIFKFFTKLAKNTEISDTMCRNAKYQAALMQAKGLVYTQDYAHVAQVLKNAALEELLSLGKEMEANYYLAEIVLEGNSDIITVLKAHDIKNKALKNGFTPDGIRPKQNESTASFESRRPHSYKNHGKTLTRNPLDLHIVSKLMENKALPEERNDNVNDSEASYEES